MNMLLKFMMVDGVSAGMGKVGRQLDGMGDKGKSLQKIWKGVTKDFQQGTKAMLATKAAWERGLKPGVEAAAELQTAMDGLEATLTNKVKPLEQVRQELDAIERTAEKVGNPLPLDKTQVIEAGKALAKMNLEIKDIQGQGGALAASSFLSVLENIDPNEAAGLVGDVGTQFKLLGSEYFDLASTMSKASDSSSTSAQELGEGLKFVGARAQSLGISYKETLAILALEAKMGLKGSQGGTAFEAMLGKMSAPTRQSKKAMAGLGLKFFDDGEFVGMEAAVERLKGSMKGLTKEKQGIALDKLFGTEAGRAARALVQAEGGYQAILATMDNQLDIQDKVALKLKGHQGQWDAIAGTVKSTVATAYQPLLGVMTDIESSAAGVAGKINASVSESKGLQSTVSGVSAGILALGAGYGAFKLGRAGLGGLSMLKAMPGLGTAGGIAAGKAAEAATGVKAVFVTNWPDGGSLGPGSLGGAAGGAASTAGGVAGGGMLAGLAGKAKGLMTAAKVLIAGASVTSVAGAGAASLAGAAGVGLAGGALVGTGINAGLKATGLDASLHSVIAQVLAAANVDFGKRVLADLEASRVPQNTPVNLTVNVDKDGGVEVLAPSGLGDPKVQARRQGAR